MAGTAQIQVKSPGSGAEVRLLRGMGSFQRPLSPLKQTFRISDLDSVPMSAFGHKRSYAAPCILTVNERLLSAKSGHSTVKVSSLEDRDQFIERVRIDDAGSHHFIEAQSLHVKQVFQQDPADIVAGERRVAGLVLDARKTLAPVAHGQEVTFVISHPGRVVAEYPLYAFPQAVRGISQDVS